MKRKIFLALYYGFARHLPKSATPFVGKWCNRLRVACCKRIFKRAGRIVTVDKGAYFGCGSEVEIGNDSGIGAYCILPPNIKLGNHVMMAPELLALKNNHRFDNPDIPIGQQGDTQSPPIMIGDNVWIGQRVIITPGTHVASGTVIAAGAVVTKEFEKDSIIGGNPARVIRKRF